MYRENDGGVERDGLNSDRKAQLWFFGDRIQCQPQASEAGSRFLRRYDFGWPGPGLAIVPCCCSQRVAVCSMEATCLGVSLALACGARALLASSPFKDATTIQK